MQMKTLVLIRHAKSDWEQPVASDFDRPLNARGLRDAPFMAGRFASAFPSAACIVSSPAVRAWSTAAHFAEALGVEKVQAESTLYEATLRDLIDVVHRLDSSRDIAVLVGHNPGMSQLTDYLSGEWIALPTCAVVVLTSAVNEWAAWGRDCAAMKWYDYPKKHRND